jgi:LysM repeat protein
MEERSRRSPLRFLAPAALVFFVLAFFVVLTSADVNEDGDTRSARRSEQRDLGERERTSTTEQTRRESQLPDDVYVVKTGDTLEGIAQQVGLTVERLLELNPDLDPQALVSGQEIKLRE